MDTKNIKSARMLDDILDRPRQDREDLKRLFERITELESKLLSISINYKTDSIKNENVITMEDRILKKVSLEEKFCKKRQRMMDDCDQIRSLVSRWYEEDTPHYQYMIDRYCHLMSVKSVSDKYGVSERYVYRLCSEAKKKILQQR